MEFREIILFHSNHMVSQPDDLPSLLDPYFYQISFANPNCINYNILSFFVHYFCAFFYSCTFLLIRPSMIHVITDPTSHEMMYGNQLPTVANTKIPP